MCDWKKLGDAESAKLNQYREPYHSLKPNCVFVPLAADSLCRIGAHALRFFRFLAANAPFSPSSGSSPSTPFSFHTLRLRFLFDSLEATADRLTRRQPLSSSSLPLSLVSPSRVRVEPAPSAAAAALPLPPALDS